jgi:hypothetical protein
MVFRVCALILSALLAVVPALSHVCDAGCPFDAVTTSIKTGSVDAEDCPLHRGADGDATNTPGPADAGSSHETPSHPAPCDHDGHNQALGADARKVVRLTTIAAVEEVTVISPRLFAPPSVDAGLPPDRSAPTPSPITTRSVLRI